MEYLYIFIIGYIFGSSNLAYYISKVKKIDLQATGSKNLGASNTVISIGKTAGVLVAIHDIAKSLLAIVLVHYLFPNIEHAGVIAGCAAVLGHMYPFYLRFKGGKGFASYIGMVIGLNWKFGIAIILIIIAVAYLSNYIVAGTLSTIGLSPVFFGYTNGWIFAIGMGIISLIILYKHRENLVKMKNGTEFKIFKNRSW